MTRTPTTTTSTPLSATAGEGVVHRPMASTTPIISYPAPATITTIIQWRCVQDVVVKSWKGFCFTPSTATGTTDAWNVHAVQQCWPISVPRASRRVGWYSANRIIWGKYTIENIIVLCVKVMTVLGDRICERLVSFYGQWCTSVLFVRVEDIWDKSSKCYIVYKYNAIYVYTTYNSLKPLIAQFIIKTWSYSTWQNLLDIAGMGCLKFQILVIVYSHIARL